MIDRFFIHALAAFALVGALAITSAILIAYSIVTIIQNIGG